MRAVHCGRIHLGPICVNGGKSGEAICESCGQPVSQRDRIQVQRTWDQVHKMLAKFKDKKESKK